MIIESIVVVAGLGLVFGLGLAYASKRFAVKVDERVSQVLAILPGANCGACGYAGCAAFAEAVVAGKVPVDGCIPGQKKVADKVAEILGGESVEEKEKNVAQLHCDGGINCKDKAEYEGVDTCKAAMIVANGNKACAFGCMGFGDCCLVCPVDAISMSDRKLPVVDKAKCIACGKCVAECPKGLYELVDEKKKVHVLCSNKDPGIKVTKECDVGCIACRMCENKCPFDAIHVIDNLARIDYSKCKVCGLCVSVCPRNIIIDERKAKNSTGQKVINLEKKRQEKEKAEEKKKEMTAQDENKDGFV